MNAKTLTYYLVSCLILATAGCASNVRWKALYPSKTLTQKIANDIYVTQYDDKPMHAPSRDYASFEAFEKIMTNPVNEHTRPVSHVLNLPNGHIIIMGYSKSPHKLGLTSAANYARFKLTDKPAYGYKYVYEGKITGLGFQAQHMTMSSDQRTQMLLATKPARPYTVWLYYKDGTVAQFDFLSSRTSSRLGGGFKAKKLNHFDGLFWVNYDDSSDTFSITGPYNR